MSIPVITFFNNKGGVGKTSMVYHLAYMFAERGVRVLAADLDPQCNLTAAFMDEEELEDLFSPHADVRTIVDAVTPLREGTGDIAQPALREINEHLKFIPGAISLSEFEDDLSNCWARCLDRDKRSFRVISAFWRVVQRSAEGWADVVLIDLGPNLGSINRAALISADHVIIPLGPDLFSLKGLENLGPTLRKWRTDWKDRVERNPDKAIVLPSGTMSPIGYIVLRHAIRMDRPVKAYERWIAKIPLIYNNSVLGQSRPDVTLEKDNNCIGRIKDYRSLMPLAQEAHKPMFLLKPADGALGAHMRAVQDCYNDFKETASIIALRIGISISENQ